MGKITVRHAVIQTRNTNHMLIPDFWQYISPLFSIGQ